MPSNNQSPLVLPAEVSFGGQMELGLDVAGQYAIRFPVAAAASQLVKIVAPSVNGFSIVDTADSHLMLFQPGFVQTPCAFLVQGDCDFMSDVNGTSWAITQAGSASFTSVGVSGNITAATGDFTSINATGGLLCEADVDTLSTYQVNGVQVVSAQGAAVANATGAGDVVAQLNALLARLRAHGLIAT